MVINISVQYSGGLLPDIILPVGNPFKYHVVALYLQPLQCILLLPCVMVYYIAAGLFLCSCLAIMYSITGFSPTLYCGPNVICIGEPG